MSVLKVKEGGVWKDIPTIVGEAAGFGTVTATVDTNIGTPAVVVTSSGEDTAKNFAFQFKNLGYDDSDLQDDFADLANDFDVLQGQFDTAVAAVTTDTEVTDIRVGADGVTDTTAGASVRRQFTDVKSAIDSYNTPNLLPFNYMGKGKYLKQTYTPYTDQSLYTESIEMVNGITVGAISVALTANTLKGVNEWVKTFLSDYSKVGDFVFSVDLSSDTDITDLDFQVYVGGGVSFSKLNMVLTANTWVHVDLPITLTSGSSTIQMRFTSDTSCNMKIANARMTLDSPALAIPLDAVYKRNDIVERSDLLLQVGANLFSGKYSKDNYYLEYATGAETANSSYAISDKIYVVGGEKYTFNEHHHVFAYDKYDNPVALWRASDFTDTITAPLSAYYLLANINKGWANPLIVNHGESATSAEYYHYDGAVLKNGSVTQEKLASGISILPPDGSIVSSKLASGSVITSKIADANVTSGKLANGSVIRDKLDSGVIDYFADGANLADETITKDKLSASLIQFIETAGGGTVTNNPDDVTIKANGDDELYVNSDAFSVVAVTSNTSLSDLNTRISAISGKVILLLKADVAVSANAQSLASNLAVVYGLGGMFTATSLSTRWYLLFPEGCRFVCGKYQMFHQYICPSCLSGYLDGEAIPQWWGAVADGVTSDTIPVDSFMASKFKTVRFPQGIYVAYPANSISGRTIIMDEGSIIDGVFHISYGSSLGAESKFWCKNVTVIGKVVATVRVGGAQADGLYIPDGIRILGVNSDYVNQTAEGGCKGVHWHFGCKNLVLGDIVVDEIIEPSSGYAYALGIDSSAGEENPSNVYIRSIRAGANTSTTFDVILASCKNVRIESIDVESGDSIMYSLSIGSCEGVTIGQFKTKAENNASAKAGVLVNASDDVYIDNIEIVPDVNSALAMWGYWVNNSSNVFANNIHTKYMAQGLRFVGSSSVYVGSHITDHDTAQKGDSSSTYKINNTFIVS